MAKRPTQNTKASEDSLQGGAPAKAEGAVQTGESDTSTATTGDAAPADAASAALAAALQDIGADDAKALPDPITIAFLERRLATAASAIELDGHRFGLDDPIPLTAPQFEQLKATGALVETSWDELTPL